MANILVVDDDLIVGEMLCTILRRDAHKVKYTTDGKEALAILKNTTPDLVITDIVMPNMNGLALVSALNETYPSLKVIAISGGGRDGPEDYLTCAQTRGAGVVLTKPFEHKDILNAVNSLLNEDD